MEGNTVALQDLKERDERISWDAGIYKSLTDFVKLRKDVYNKINKYTDPVSEKVENIYKIKPKQYVKDVWQYYTTEEVYNLQEQHDSYVWDYVRHKHEQEYKHQFRNLGVDHKVPGGHIQAHLYGEWFDHCKGKRKIQGKSKENPYNG